MKRVRGEFPEASEERKPPLLAPPPAASPSPQPALQSWAPGLSSSLLSLLPSSSLFPRQHSRPQQLSPLSSLRASILLEGGGSPWLHMRTRAHCPQVTHPTGPWDSSFRVPSSASHLSPLPTPSDGTGSFLESLEAHGHPHPISFRLMFITTQHQVLNSKLGT